MKILFVVPGGNDLGGIITSTEQYVAGLKEAGHEVNFMTVGFGKSGTRRDRTPRGKFEHDFTIGVGTGVLMHPTQGWRGEQRMSLMNTSERAAFIHIGKKHDIIIWASVYGFRNPDTEGRNEWLEAIKKLKGKHVFFIHDDHLPTRYPWAYALAPYARLFIGVQPCSYDSLQAMPAPRAMVYTPLPPRPRTITSVVDRRGFFMCQVWKGWKHGDRLIAAAPYMPAKSVTFAGDGIQLRYIRSPMKCPPRWAGLWDAAMKKQSYVGVLQERERDMLLKQQKFLVDLSVRENSGQYNRIAQEAMAQGCVVIADPRFITSSKGLFQPHQHYIPIDASLEPKELAAELLRIERETSIKQYYAIQRAARLLLGRFDRKALATEIIDEFVEPTPWADTRTDVVSAKQAKEYFRQVFGEI